MAQIDKIKNNDVLETEGIGRRIRHIRFGKSRADGNSVVWARPKKVLASSVGFVLFAAALGIGCWAVNWGVTYLVSLLV